MFLRSSIRKKNGKAHRYWSIVENRRVAGGRVLQRHVLYLGEIDGGQQEAWQKTIEIFEDGQPHPKTVALPFRQAQGPEPAEGLPDQEFDATGLKGEHPPDNQHMVRIRLSEIELRRPPRRRCPGQAEAGKRASRQWGACRRP